MGFNNKGRSKGEGLILLAKCAKLKINLVINLQVKQQRIISKAVLQVGYFL